MIEERIIMGGPNLLKFAFDSYQFSRLNNLYNSDPSDTMKFPFVATK